MSTRGESGKMQFFIKKAIPKTESLTKNEDIFNQYNTLISNVMTKTSEKIDSNLFVDDEEPSEIIDTTDIDFSTNDVICCHNNVIKESGIMICEDCGIELYEEISHEQDWRYYGDQDSRNNKDPSRCQFRKSPEKGIKKELEKLEFPPDICEKSDDLYMQVTKGEIKRSELRKGIMFATVFESYRILNKPKTPEELSKKFGLDRKGASRGITYFRLRCPREYFDNEDISAKHFIPKVMKKLDIKQEHIDKVIKLYEKIKDSCIVVNRSNPQSTSKALIYYYLRRIGCNFNPIKYGKIVGLSEVIILRISSEISRVLGTQKQISLS